jgi:hypothetical protein
MAFKEAVVVMALDGDPKKHRTTIKTNKVEVTLALIERDNFAQGVEVCKELVKNQGIQSFLLCPGFTHKAIADIVDAIGPGVAVNVARGDVPSTLMVGEILAKEGWFD